MTSDERSAAGGAEIERRVSEFLHGELLSPGASVDRDSNLLSGEVLDSISVLRLVAFVQDAFHVGVQPSHFTVENFRSVAAIAAYVRRALDSQLPRPTSAMNDPAPQLALTHSQQQIWVGQRLHPASPLYNMAFAFVFPAALRSDVLLEAWQRVADASDALRTRVEDDGAVGARWTLTAGAATDRGGRAGPVAPTARSRCRGRSRRRVPTLVP